MHQTFYIDIDEEITSIVDRLKKAKASEVVLVIPKRALLIQSIVNLKLLKKEAENLGIQIMIVTQDKLGKLLIEKAGILVQNKLDETLEEEGDLLEAETETKEDKTIKETKEDEKLKKRIEEIGSDDYFSSAQISQQEMLRKEVGEDIARANRKEKDFEKITNKELVIDMGKSLKKKSFFKKKNKMPMDLSSQLNMNIQEEESLPKERETLNKTKLSPEKNKMQKLANFFQTENTIQPQKEINAEKEIKAPKKKKISPHIGGKFWKSFLIFGLLAGVVFVLVGAYLFLPKVEVKIYPKIETQSSDFQIKGDSQISSIDVNNEKIPIKEVEIEDEYTEEFNSTGEKNVSNQKAQGTITIYNEYSSSPQPLVATTRFLSEDGKLFRLIEGVTIPGMKTENGEKKPGSVEAQVAADQSGAEFNIGPAKFSIPGFESSGEEKYSKFYATSKDSMTGGGDGNEKVGVVTQANIDNAKKATLAKLEAESKERIEQKIESGWIVLDEAIRNEDTQYLTSNSVDEVAKTFSVTVKVKRKALVFKESDLKEVIAEKIAEKNKAYKINQENVSLDFGKADADWENKEMVIRLRATIDIGSSLDLENIKKGILGKSEEELKEFLKTYSEIEKIDIDYWPFFISGKIPMYEKRVTVILDKN